MTAEPEGRELDAWLAEKAMGWVRVQRSYPLADDVWVGYRPGEQQDTPLSVPHYSTDLTAAMGLAEEMREKGWNINIDLCPRANQPYEVEAFRCDEYGFQVKGSGVIEADTLPMTIATAAYRALKGMRDE